MQDHGADAATVVASASVDVSKEVIKISAAVLKNMFLWAIEGSKIKSGETNIDKLIMSLDEGDRIASAVIDPKHTEQLVELSKKHGVTYAVVENQKGETIVYYKESQSERMQHILEDILEQTVKENPEEEEIKEESSKEERAGESVQSKEKFPASNKKEKEEKQDISSILQEGKANQENTSIIFNNENPLNFVELFKAADGTQQFSIYRDGKWIGADEMGGFPTEEQVKAEVSQYKEYKHFSVKGTYKEKDLLKMVNEIAKQKQESSKVVMAQKEKETFFDNMMKQPAWMDGTLHIVSDANNSKDFIAVYKQLETKEDGIDTKNTAVVFKDGIAMEGMDPAIAFSKYDGYKHIEKNGKGAEKHFEKLLSESEDKKQNQRMDSIEQSVVSQFSNIENTEETHILFDYGVSSSFIEIRQIPGESGPNCSLYLHKENEVIEISAVEASEYIKKYDEPITIAAKGHYDHEALQKRINPIAKEQAEQKKAIKTVQAKEKMMQDLMKETAGLDGTLHTIVDSKNPNNRILIYKDIESFDGQMQTVNHSMVFLDGKKCETAPLTALKKFEKYKHTEKYGKAAQKQFFKLVDVNSMNWNKSLSRDGIDNKEPIKKTLDEYEKAVAQIKATRTAKPISEIKLDMGQKQIPVKGER